LRFSAFLQRSAAVAGILTLMTMYPELDPTSYLPYYTRCARISEQEAVDLASARLNREIDYLVRHFNEPAASIRTAKFVRVVDWRPLGAYSFTVTYQTELGQLVDFNIGPECGIEVGFPDRLVPPI